MSCHVDDTSLQECQAGFQKLADLLKQINADNIAYRTKSVQRQQEIQSWENQNAIQLQQLEQGKTAPGGYVFDANNQLVNCNTVSASDCYIGAQCNCFDGRVNDNQRRCTACSFKKCDCTAGSGEPCHTSCDQLRHSDVSTYQAQYNAWLAANPKPAPLPPYTPVQVNAGDMICAQCTQCQDFTQIQAQNVSFDNINQAMQCVGKMQDKIAANKAADQQQAAAGSSMKKVIIILLIIIILVAVGVGVTLFVMKGSSSTSNEVNTNQNGGIWY